jgi:hypothetical protein
VLASRERKLTFARSIAYTHTHTHTHTFTHAWSVAAGHALVGGWIYWIGSWRVGRGCGRRLGTERGYVCARRSFRCVRVAAARLSRRFVRCVLGASRCGRAVFFLFP